LTTVRAMIMRTHMPAVPRDDDPERRGPPPADRCSASLDGSLDKRCCLARDHAGLHRWRSSDRRQTFSWG
jgi:hypothetical protein